ncbi:hypothetical protein [Nonomuraea fuscirosea]|uniref:hypothetical protein n=1 Tax=Nonomuraea fuscirosea TaxID=1291556 RepID=UPI003440CC4C
MNLVEITELFLTKKGALKRHGASMGERGRARASAGGRVRQRSVDGVGHAGARG